MIKKIIIMGILSVFAYAQQIYATFDVFPMKSSKLTLSVSGVVKALHVDIGDKITKGQILLELDNERDIANVNLSKSQITLSKVDKEHYNNELLRYQKIKDVIDQELFESKQYVYQKSKSVLNQSKMAYKLQEVILSKKVLKAPYTGVVTNKFVNVGDGVSGPSTPLLTIMNTKNVKLVLSFDEKYWNKIKIGQTFTYKVDGLDKKFKGIIAKVYPSIDSKSRKLQAEVYTSDILPGLFGDGQITVE